VYLAKPNINSGWNNLKIKVFYTQIFNTYYITTPGGTVLKQRCSINHFLNDWQQPNQGMT